MEVQYKHKFDDFNLNKLSILSNWKFARTFCCIVKMDTFTAVLEIYFKGIFVCANK